MVLYQLRRAAGECSYRHGMRDKGQSIAAAMAKADAFVRSQFEKAKKLLAEENSLKHIMSLR